MNRASVSFGENRRSNSMKQRRSTTADSTDRTMFFGVEVYQVCCGKEFGMLQVWIV